MKWLFSSYYPVVSIADMQESKSLFFLVWRADRQSDNQQSSEPASLSNSFFLSELTHLCHERMLAITFQL